MGLSRSAKYYRKNKKARDKKNRRNAIDKKKRSAVKKRVESTRARRKAKREGRNIKGKDAAHVNGKIVFKDSSKNRGSKTDSPGDRRARGGKSKKRLKRRRK